MAQEGSVSFAADVRPLFRQVDIDHMSPMNVFLDDYEYMSKPENAKLVHDFLTGEKQPQMPPDGAWSQEHLDLFARWVRAGCPK